MALATKQLRHVEHPTEAGAWFDLSLPLTAGDVATIPATVSTEAEASLYMLAAALKGWSYDAPITIENVRTLDLDTYVFLTNVVREASGVRSDEEKKDSSLSFMPTTGPGPAVGLVSSGTSSR